MQSLAALCLCATVLLSGCATTLPPSKTPSAAATALACPPVDPEVDRLSARIEMHNDREGFYARAELAGIARDRDELLRRLLVHHGQIAACTPIGPAREEALASSRQRMMTLLLGLHPGWEGHPIRMTDVSRPPHIFPFFTRACVDAHGLENGMACYFIYSPYLLTFDLVTLPIGSWFWAAPDRKEDLSLPDAFPPTPALKEAVAKVMNEEPE